MVANTEGNMQYTMDNGVIITASFKFEHRAGIPKWRKIAILRLW
jgi:hypothetical protein